MARRSMRTNPCRETLRDVGEREVMFVPAYADAFGRGPHAFYSTQGGEVRQIQVGPTAAELIAGDATPEVSVPA